MSIAKLKRFKTVEQIDQHGMPDDEFFVSLKPGWAFEDAAAKPEDDPEGAFAGHHKGGPFDMLKSELKSVEPCRCGRCVKLLQEEC